MEQKTRCTNMNHSRSQISIRFCPTCGVILNANIKQNCDEAKHASLRKNRNVFCYECGKKLNK